jgi:hypothetical protein
MQPPLTPEIRALTCDHSTGTAMVIPLPFAGSHRSTPPRLPLTDGRNGASSGVCGSS